MTSEEAKRILAAWDDAVRAFYDCEIQEYVYFDARSALQALAPDMEPPGLVSFGW